MKIGNASSDEIPRRFRIDLATPAELAIRAARDAVESVGADVLLTDAVVLLGQALDKVADYVDAHPAPTARQSFDTTLSPPEETSFQAWKAKYAPRDSGADYDLRGAFKAGLIPDPVSGHWPDRFKKPNHPTFSNQSQYAQFGNPGRWEGERFIPPVPKPELTAHGFRPYDGVTRVGFEAW